MRLNRFWCLGTLVLGLGALACGARTPLQHPLRDEKRPEFQATAVRSVAVLPFGSDIGDDQDPDRLAADMVASEFNRRLPAQVAYGLITSSEVQRMIDAAALQESMRDFYEEWISDQKDVDRDFIQKVADLAQVDAVLAGAVDIWFQDPVDITETGSARTAVGVIAGLFDGRTGDWLWLARDENSKDAVRYSGLAESNVAELERVLERSNQRTAGGVYAPPDYFEVVDLVVQALVEAVPSGR